MELRTAYEVLGVNEGDSRAQLWQAYLEGRSPRRSLSVPPRRRERMEEALAAVEQHFTVTPRPLYLDECHLCGWGPAVPLPVTEVTGMLVLFTVTRSTATLCRRCGHAVARDAQNHCLALGWWGLFAAFANLAALRTNHRRLARHERALAPTPVWRRPGPLAAPLPSPRESEPLWRRPSSWALPAVAALWLLYLAAGWVVG